jgi:hypothetical protein
MIQPLRTVHRRIFVALALVLPAVLLVGIGARYPRPSPNANAPEAPATAYLLRESDGLWQKHAIEAKFYTRSDRPRDIYVVLQPAQELNEPDLLLYWTVNEPQGNSLPSKSQFVGVYTAGKAFVLPLEKERAGHLILFSLAHHTVFDTARVETLP